MLQVIAAWWARAIVRELQRQGYTNIITRTHKELDLCRQQDVEEFFAQPRSRSMSFWQRPRWAASWQTRRPWPTSCTDNMTLEMNAIHSAWKNGCKKLEFLGSSCIYPRMAPQPMQESCLLTSELEKTNEAYALAKISGLKYCEFLNRQYGTDYISVMPTNLYGPNDNYHPTHSHVVPGPHPPLPRGQGQRRRERHLLGRWQLRCASSCMWTTSPTCASS